jgi:hypothetical protein
MSREKRVLPLFLTFILSVSSFGQAKTASPGKVENQPATNESGATAATTPTMSEAERKRFDALRTEGFDALYNLDYEGARRRFMELTKAYPDHPAGAQFLATSLWLKTLNESRRLQASLYNTEGFYAKSEEKTDPKVLAEFRELTRQAKTLAEARLKRDPKDIEALYFLGATEGLKAAFAGAVERSFMSALRNGSDSVDRHRDVLKLDPAFHDAEITIGMYDYVVSTLPLPVKIMAAIGGIRGSKKKGLERLERVTREGHWAQDDAKVLLIALYKREKRFNDALALARDLAAKYPRNYLFKLEAADALVSQAALDRPTDREAAAKSEREAFAVFESLLQAERPASKREAAAAPNAAHARLPFDLIHYDYGEALLVAGQPERASKEFIAAANTTGAEQGLATRAQLRAAQALDVAGRRAEALAQYKLVLTRADVYDVHAEARRGLKEPYKISDTKIADAAPETPPSPGQP